jgi:hypothetical protein
MISWIYDAFALSRNGKISQIYSFFSIFDFDNHKNLCLMKKFSFTVLLMFLALLAFPQTKYQYKVITSVESVVPMGLGRSRIIDSKENVNVEDFTTSRAEGKKSAQKNVKRGDVKVNNFDETKLLNFSI